MAFMNVRGRSLSDIYDVAEHTVKQLGIEVVFLDSISRMGGGSLVDDEAVNRVMDQLNALVPTWVALAHSPRADATHVFGSQMFDAAADVAIQLRGHTVGQGQTTAVALDVTKRNDMPQPGLKILAYEWTDKGLTRVRHAREHEFPELETGRTISLEQQVLDWLLLRGKGTATEIADETGLNRGKISSLLSHNSHFVHVGRDGAKIFYGVRHNEA
jgi:hypothetical protein